MRKLSPILISIFGLRNHCLESSNCTYSLQNRYLGIIRAEESVSTSEVIDAVGSRPASKIQIALEQHTKSVLIVIWGAESEYGIGFDL